MTVTEVFPLHVHAAVDGKHRSFTVWSKEPVSNEDLVAVSLVALNLSHMRAFEINYGAFVFSLCSARLSDDRILTITQVDGSGPASQTNFAIN